MVLRPPHRRRIEGGVFDDGSRPFGLPPIEVEDLTWGSAGSDLLGVLVLGVLRDRFTSRDLPKPELFDVERELLDEAKAAPTRRQYGMPQIVIGETLENAQHVSALDIERVKQHRCFVAHRRPSQRWSDKLSDELVGVRSRY